MEGAAQLLSVLDEHSTNIDMACNVNKTVCMVFKPKLRTKVVADVFPQFSLGTNLLQFVKEFKYLGQLSSCYNKCVKLFFFGFKRYDSVTKVLIETGMPSFDTILHNSHVIFSRCWTICSIHNKTVGHLDALNRR